MKNVRKGENFKIFANRIIYYIQSKVLGNRLTNAYRFAMINIQGRQMPTNI